MFKRLALLLSLAVALAGCAVEVDHYRDQTPPLDLRQYFTGRVDAWGMFQKRSGEVVKRFSVAINGYSRGEQLILEEDFTFSDGSTDRRVWTFTPDGPEHWRGTAHDVVGEGHLQVAGNALRLRYTLRLPVGDSVYDVKLDDWMYLIDEHTLANRSFMTKFGVEVGQITLFFRKRGAEGA
ncbi:DUF3833 domain-containing protein [Pseudomonas sp. RL]|uniref:DUF3833 domain-containing protein n=1 Tax=Pseudomonas sp. RL TaxID=1452718 RepID=UPI000480BABE|nr:DUF3833 domain-containing protein [Pseudomonas sp. RL]